MSTKYISYFWRNGEVFTLPTSPYIALVEQLGLLELPCVDMNCTAKSLRYGRFVANKGWVAIPYSRFPKEFLATLLLIT